MLLDKGEGEGVAAVELADLFCSQARRRVDRLLHELWHNDDADEYKAALRVMDGRYTFLEAGILDPSGDGPMIPDLHVSGGPAAAGGGLAGGDIRGGP
jgi:hypothetical protein